MSLAALFALMAAGPALKTPETSACFEKFADHGQINPVDATIALGAWEGVKKETVIVSTMNGEDRRMNLAVTPVAQFK